ncbi:MAG: right-handed parallel beta-helix repeat-containing protein [Spirochaetes bacterium]|nr:right-handed parallel beta-helix repeat-containing protein [Spirochaetota bacterium]
MRWDACTNADFSNYIIFRTIGNNYSNLSDGDIICRAYASNATNIVDTPGVSGMYYYFATAVDTNGNESWYSAPASITFNGGYAVSNTNTGVRYIDLASACSAVADNETLHVLMNIQGAGAVVNGRSGVTITKASNIAFTPQLRGDFASTGIFFSNCTACTIRDLQFTSYAMGIAIMDSGGMLLSNITISVSVSNAIALFTNATNTTIRAASLFSNQCGIRVWSHGNTISGSHITSNFGEGILFMYSNATSNAIVGNDVIANGYNVYGIDACLSVGTMIASNLVQLNYSGLATGISNYVYNNRFISNTSSAIYIGKGGTTTRGTSIVCNELMSSVIYPYSSGNGIYFNGPQNSHFIASNSIISFYYGIYINNGLSNSVFLSNAIISNSYGIYNFNSGVSSNIIAGNYFTRNFSYGLFIYSAKTNLIMSNMFSNTAAAICISGACELNTICYNIMKNNSYGCIISWISTNTIAFNNFQNNTRNLYIGTLINFCFAVSNYYGTRTFSNMSVSSNVFDVAPWRLTPIDFTKNITPPDCPALVTAATNAIREVNVAWSPVTNGGLSHYNIFRSTAPTFHDILDSELVATVSAGTTNYTDTPQVTNTYRYYVTAVDTNDNEGWYSPAAVVLVTTVNYIPVISNFSAVPDVALGYVALSYSLYDSNTTDLMTGTFEYTESGKSNWTAIAAASISNAPVNCSNGDYVSYWYPSGIDTTKKIDIRMRVTSRDRVSAYAYDLDTILSGMFSMRSDLAQIKTLNNPYRGAEPGIVFVNLTADAVITVYTVTGKFVSEVTVDKNTPDGLLGRAIWDVRNKQDAAVTAGIYICIVRSPSLNKSRTVKVLVAR